MLKKDLLKLIENVEDNQDIDELLKDTDLAKSLQDSGLTLEAFKEKIKNDKEFRSYIESENDKYHNKALKTWKENNLEKELEPFISEKYPDLVTDPVKKEAAEAKKEIEKLKAEMARKDLLSEATKYALEKKLPVKFIEKLLGEDLDSTRANLDSFAEEWSKGLESLVDEKMKQSSYIPGGNNPDGSKISIGASIAAQNNDTSSVQNDPWAK
ncbi:DUF4355 domain-containing protein [Clostridium botulinum]|uniref:DUF4355 domain-containing protein n=1 Tax=Clostridium botulinum TaxID=1491 RepID=UPI0013F0A8DA|nr:DUF4355 domain-containing protein [Clostridium botulinum]MBY6846713.1 DUF4355 domain-containing protein [Clostridium botulinum]NEZ80380.1 DUF4355 domain-containing protein [Clostridium botulinum]NFA17692.1 DUF4355 domain-containing protein [Clostridium botulinum]NFA54348.1 DUF4355 domain-containing protein [Clostridium botulinum]NFA67836.1 DUF4355 domain-containing protein [Clostridium botulinum]